MEKRAREKASRPWGTTRRDRRDGARQRHPKTRKYKVRYGPLLSLDVVGTKRQGRRTRARMDGGTISVLNCRRNVRCTSEGKYEQSEPGASVSCSPGTELNRNMGEVQQAHRTAPGRTGGPEPVPMSIAITRGGRENSAGPVHPARFLVTGRALGKVRDAPGPPAGRAHRDRATASEATCLGGHPGWWIRLVGIPEWEVGDWMDGKGGGQGGQRWQDGMACGHGAGGKTAEKGNQVFRRQRQRTKTLQPRMSERVDQGAGDPPLVRLPGEPGSVRGEPWNPAAAGPNRQQPPPRNCSSSLITGHDLTGKRQDGVFLTAKGEEVEWRPPPLSAAHPPAAGLQWPRGPHALSSAGPRPPLVLRSWPAVL